MAKKRDNWFLNSVMNRSNSKRRSLVHEEEDANISAFRRSNKIIAVAFTLLIISISILIVASTVHLLPIHGSSRSPPLSGASPVESFCSYSDVPLCVRAVNRVIGHRFAAGHDQIFALSLQTAAEDLQRVISNSVSETQKFDLRNCADSLRKGLGRIGESLAIMRARPFFGSMSRAKRDEMVNRIMEAEEDVGSCLDDLAEVERPPEKVAEMTAELADVKVYLHSAYRFVVGSVRTGKNHFF